MDAIDQAAEPSASIHIDLAGDVAKVPQGLGTLSDAILSGRASAFVLHFGQNAVDPRLLGTLTRWFRRNETLLRTRTWAFVFVVPGFWHALQWRLALRLDPPVMRAAIVRTPAAADAWLAAKERRGGVVHRSARTPSSA